MRHQLVATAAGVLCLASCSPDRSSIDRTFELEEEVRIGGVDGPIEETFGSVGAVAPGFDGSVLVSDRQGPSIHRYDWDGAYLGSIGGVGQGPGEISSVDGLGVSVSGEITVFDARNARITRFAENGEYVESIPVNGALGANRGFVSTQDGTVFLQVAPETGFRESRHGYAADWMRIDRSGDSERLWANPLEERDGPRYVVSGRGGYYRPFVVMTLSAMAPDGSFYTARNDRYRITHAHPSGDTTEVYREETPIRLSADERRQWEAMSEQFATRPGARRSDFFPIPDTKPLVRELVVDVDGRLWVSRYTEAELVPYSEWERIDRAERGLPTFNLRDRLRWDIFGPDDQYIGSVTLPAKTSFVTARRDEVWGVQAGDYNEEYVVRWRMLEGES